MLVAVLARPVDGAYERRCQCGSSLSSLVASHSGCESTRNPLRCREAAIINDDGSYVCCGEFSEPPGRGPGRTPPPPIVRVVRAVAAEATLAVKGSS